MFANVVLGPHLQYEYLALYVGQVLSMLLLSLVAVAAVVAVVVAVKVCLDDGERLSFLDGFLVDGFSFCLSYL